MEIICPAWYPGAGKLIDALPLLADQGVTAVEIGIESPEYFDHRNAYEFERLVSKLSHSGIRVHSIHAPFGPQYDISSPEDQVQDRGVEALIDAIEVASALDAGFVIVHASDDIGEVGQTAGRRIDRARGVLRELAGVAQESRGILALENLPPGYLGHTPEEILALLDGSSRACIGVCFDSGHANLSGRFTEFAEALLPHSVTTHLHDNDGSEDQHRFPGEGNIDWRRFGSLYRKVGCSASIMLECMPPESVAWRAAFQRLRSTLGG